MASPDDLKGAPASTAGVAPFTAPAGLLDRLRAKLGGAPAPPALPPGGGASDEDGDEEDDGMLRMSFLEHLQELRMRIIYALAGIAVAFGLSLTFSKELWRVVSEPAVAALTTLGVHPPKLAAIEPMEQFNVIWFKLPILCAIFLASPWVLYQVWAFISPGLYKCEKKLAAPFVLCSAGLFILGGLFAYFVVFRFGLTFLMGIGIEDNVMPMVSISKYFDLFVNVTLGVGIVFELPVLIFFLTLLRIASPAFLLRQYTPDNRKKVWSDLQKVMERVGQRQP
jgi:sec-independent protein translocase protein TatC